MISFLALTLLFLVPELPSADPSIQVRLTIARDPYTSSDRVTLCRVRAVNSGPHSFSGKALAFEARATSAGAVVRQRGRFGLVLEPYGSLETIVAIPGRHDRLEVVLLPGKAPSAEREQKVRAKASGQKRRRHAPR